MTRRLGTIAALACVASLSLGSATWAVEPDEMLKDPRLEARAEAISKTLRCVVCQNENIDDSGAPLASDMRRLVRERVSAGDTDDQVRAYLVARYGNFVLLKPPLQPDTWLLWFGPAAVLLVAAAGFSAAYLRRKPAATAPAPLTADERKQLDALLADTPPGNTP